MENKKRPIRSLLLILLALTVGLGAGFYAGRAYAQPENNELLLTVSVNEEAGFREFSSEELGGNYTGITYLNVDAVCINMNGKEIPLEVAIRDGHVTVEKLIAQAQEDVRNRICVLKYDTTLGASEFVYSYKNQYDLMVRYDIFECSDGKQYLLKDFIITPYGKSKNVNLGFTYIGTDGKEISLKYEDWGLKFTDTTASPTGIIVNYTQQGGMAAGDLSVKWYHIYNDQGMMDENLELPLEPIPIRKNTADSFSLTWESVLGTLPSGEYTLLLYVYDTFDETQIHPLIQKYCYGQYYTIPFSIP